MQRHLSGIMKLSTFDDELCREQRGFIATGFDKSFMIINTIRQWLDLTNNVSKAKHHSTLLTLVCFHFMEHH